jgi:hypothetical protein
VRLEAEPGGFFKLAEPLLVSILKRQFEADLANLKDLMETHALRAREATLPCPFFEFRGLAAEKAMRTHTRLSKEPTQKGVCSMSSEDSLRFVHPGIQERNQSRKEE